MKIRTKYLGLAFIALLAAPAMLLAAGNADKEISTATTHAMMAGNAKDAPTAVMHFHHVINCLVGPKGKMFDPAVGNPCKGMGDGALNDVAPKTKQYETLQHALKLAEKAVHAKNLQETQKYSAHISQMLKKAQTGG